MKFHRSLQNIRFLLNVPHLKVERTEKTTQGCRKCTDDPVRLIYKVLHMDTQTGINY
jgi:hypothetical protein